MKLKLNLNKLCKLDNIEDYSMDTIHEMQKAYQDYLDESEGVDIEYPEFKFKTAGRESVRKGRRPNHKDVKKKINISEDQNELLTE